MQRLKEVSNRNTKEFIFVVVSDVHTLAIITAVGSSNMGQC